MKHKIFKEKIYHQFLSLENALNFMSHTNCMKNEFQKVRQYLKFTLHSLTFARTTACARNN